MNNEDPYESWLEKKRSLEVSPDFSSKVMARISAYKHERDEAAMRKPDLLHRWIEWVSLHPVIQRALTVAGLVLGVARLVVSLRFILSF